MSGLVVLMARLALAAVLLLAATGKSLDFRGTRETLRAFGVPAAFLTPGAVALPAVETLIALGLLIDATTRFAGAGAVLLLLLFITVLGRSLRGDEPAPACNCFGQLGQAPIGRKTLARNAVLIVPGLAAAFAGPGSVLPWWLATATATAALAAGALADRRRPGRLGARAPSDALAALDGGAPVVFGPGPPRLVIFLSGGCGPCELLTADLPRWPKGLPELIVITDGKPVALPSGRVLTADAERRAAFGVVATPAALMLDERGRLASVPALGATAIEALGRRWGAGERVRSAPLNGLAAQAFGVRVEIVTDAALSLEAELPSGAQVLERISHDSPMGSSRWTVLTRGGGGSGTLYRDGVFAGRGATVTATLELLAADVRLHVAEHAPRHAFVHAGVVAWRGRAILVPGRSFTGKSTFVSALLGAGARYLSDEYAVIDAEGLVHPYDKPISLRSRGGYVSHAHPIAEFTPLSPALGAHPLGAILRAPYARGASWQPVLASPGTGMMVLVENAVGVRRDPARVMRVLRLAAENSLVFDAPRGEAEATSRALLAHLDVVIPESAAARAPA